MSEIKVGQRGQIGAQYTVTIERYRTVTERATVIVNGAENEEIAKSWACEVGEDPKRQDVDWRLGNEQISECVAVRTTQTSPLTIIKKSDAVERPIHVPNKFTDKEASTTTSLG